MINVNFSLIRYVARISVPFVFLFANAGHAQFSNALRGNGMMFTPNKGQLIDGARKPRPDILFKGEGAGAAIYLRKTGVSYVFNNLVELKNNVKEEAEVSEKVVKINGLEKKKKEYRLMGKQKVKLHRVDMDFVDCNTNAETTSSSQVEGFSNYYYPHCPQGITHVYSYNKVSVKNLYTHIDLDYSGTKSTGIKYDIIIQPHADPDQVRLRWAGAESITINNEGKLVIKTSINEFHESIPKAYQNIDGKDIEVKAEYRLRQCENDFSESMTAAYEVFFKLGGYNPDYSLVIDPATWITYYGGSNDDIGTSITTDPAGNVISTGETASIDFPISNGASQVVYNDTNSTGSDFGEHFMSNAHGEGFILKFSSGGTRLFATYFGGSNGADPAAVVADLTGNITITGVTPSKDLPTLNRGGGAYFQSASLGGLLNTFIASFNSVGQLTGSTYYNGVGEDNVGNGITIDAANNIYICGGTQGSTFPVQAAYQSAFSGIKDAFVIKFNNAGVRQWATYYGGNLDDEAFGIVSDAGGDVFICGLTAGGTFPLVAPFQGVYGGGGTNGFVAELNGNTGVPVWSTFYGGNGNDACSGICMDQSGNIVLTGLTSSNINIASAGAYQPSYGGGAIGDNGFVAKFSKGGLRLWGTYLGGNAQFFIRSNSVVTDAANNIYVYGEFEDGGPGNYPSPPSCAYLSEFTGYEEQLIAKYDPNGQQTCTTYMGGTGESDIDLGGGIAIYGNYLYITGSANAGYPVTPGAFQTAYAGGSTNNGAGAGDAFIAQLCTHLCEPKSIGPDYSANVTNPCINSSVAFSSTVLAGVCDTSGSITYQWSFPGAVPASSSVPNPSGISYPNGGIYAVKLIVQTPCTIDSLEKPEYITVRDCGCTLSAQANAIANATCNGKTNGAANATVSNGSGTNYTYSWSNGVSAITTSRIHQVANLAAGSYFVTISDGVCSSYTFVTITEPAKLSDTLSFQNPGCYVEGLGSAIVNGGTFPYTYLWSNGQPNPVSTGLTEGSYTLTVTDANGCSVSGSITLTVPASGSASFSQSPSGTICSGTTVNFTNTGSGPTNFWEVYSVYSSSGSGYFFSYSEDFSYLFSSPGTYTVFHSDFNPANNCYAESASTVTVYNCTPPVITASSGNICSGSCDVITTSVSGGNGPYTYSWSTGEVTPVINACPAENAAYTVTLTDATGSTSTTVSMVMINPPIAITASAINVSCGSSNGSLTASASGGTPGYTYQWSSGIGGATVTNLSSGTYTLTLTDSKGCTAMSTATINNSGGVSVSISGSVNLSCNGVNTGSISASVSGGAAPLSYSWSNGVSGTTSQISGLMSQVTGLAAGTYTISVTDANHCLSTSNVSLTAPAALSLALNGLPVNASCGGSNGSAVMNATGGSGSLSYLWSNGSTGNTLTSAAANNYTLTVTDASGCSMTSTALISSIAGPVVSIVSSTDVSCNGNLTGSAIAQTTGGTGSVNYTWFPGGPGGAMQSALGAGTYTVSVSDANNCTSSATVSIAQPGALVAAANSTAATCGAFNGSVSVSATGGTLAYTYLWSNGSSSATLSGQGSGSYQVTVTDSHGCTQTAAETVNNSGGAVVSISATSNLTCFGAANGSASAQVTGGTAPLGFSWSSGLSGSTGGTSGFSTIDSGLAAGSYTLSVTDANGCLSSGTVTITSPPALNLMLNGSPVNATCGANNGSAVMSATGGSGSLSYVWSNGSTGNTLANAAANSYTLTVTDGNGCSMTSTALISSIAGPVLNIVSSTDVNCNGKSDGSATVGVTGGTGGFTYVWFPGGLGGAMQSALGAGTYTVSVSDANNCTSSATVSIAQPGALVAAANSTSASCGSSNGSMDVSVSGGTPGYTYQWSNGMSGATVTNLSSGSYTLTLTDSQGCTATNIGTVNNSGGAIVSLSTTNNLTCFGGTNGSATAQVSGGTAPLGFSWSSGLSGSTGGTSGFSTIDSGLAAGSYTLSVTDANGCLSSGTVTITSPPVLSPVISAPLINATCGKSNGEVAMSVTGGTSGYMFNWSGGVESSTSLPGSGGQSSTDSAMSAGTYSLTVTDGNGCTASNTVTIGNSNGPTALAQTLSNESCNGGNTGSASVTAINGTGSYAYQWSPWGGNGATATSLVAGTYSVTVTDINGCVSSGTASITEPPALTAGASSSVPLCSGSGSVSAIASGGVPAAGYNYFWSPGGATGQTISGLSNNTYSVTVTDSKGCTSTSTAALTQPLPITVKTSSVQASCAASDGSSSASASGGNGPYQYGWSNGALGATANNLSAGSYTLTVTDQSGCTGTGQVSVSNSSGPGISSLTAGNILCNGLSTGSATITASGGTGTLTYRWSNGNSGATSTGLNAGNYQVSVIDGSGCIADSSIVITAPQPLVLNPTSVSASCGKANGSASVNATGGSPGYAYFWSNSVPPSGNKQSLNVQNLKAGSYTVTVSDANGCTQTAVANVNGSPMPAISRLTTTGPSCNGDNNGSATVSATSGTGTLTYSWGNGIFGSTGGGSEVTNLAAGFEVVFITDSLGCEVDSLININQPTAISTPSFNQTNATCGNSNGSAEVSVTGGTPGYSYAWSSNAGAGVTGSTASGLSVAANLIAGSYSVTISDMNGCTKTGDVTITNTNGPAISSITATNPSCNQQTGLAAVTVNGGSGVLTYSWSNLVQSLKFKVQSSVDSSLVAGTYTVTVSDQNGCTAISTVTIQGSSGPTVSITDTVNTCAGKANGSLTVKASGGAGVYTYSWSNQLSNIQYPIPNTTDSGLIAGSYTVTVTDQNGCTATTIANVSALTSPVISITGDTSIIRGQSIRLIANGGINYLWTPASTLSNPAIHDPISNTTQTTTYTVLVTNSNNCPATDSVKITIVEPPNCDSLTLFVPTAFSPNGDGQNDVLYVRASPGCLSTLQLTIYDRWGELVFTTTNPSQGWDGTFRGKAIDMAVFTYYLTGTLTTGQAISKRGNISLIR